MLQDYQIKEHEERRNRAAATFAPALPLCGFSVLALTPRIISELEFVGNPIVRGSVAIHEGEALDFLWRIHPLFSRPKPFWRSLGSAITRARIRLAIRRRGLVAVNVACAGYMEMMGQDAVRGGGAKSPREYAHLAVHNFSFYHGQFGFSWAEYCDAPMPLLNQLYRVHLIENGAANRVTNESELMEARAAIAAAEALEKESV